LSLACPIRVDKRGGPFYTQSPMREDKKIRPEDIDRAEVRLGPFLGLSPRIWLPAAYLLVLLIVLFCLLFLPGIRNHGSYLDLSGSPDGVAVYVDGKYSGADGGKIFVRSGRHSIQLQRRGFSPETSDVDIPGRVFGSLFFPRHFDLSYALEALAPAEELSLAYAEYASWAGTGKPSSVYQIPLPLSQALLALAETGALAGREGAAAALPSPMDLAGDALAAAASSQVARDAVRSVFIHADAGSPSPLTLASGARALLSAGAQAGAVLWLSDILPRDGSKTRSRIDAAVSTMSAVSTGLSAGMNAESAPRSAGSVTVAGLRFIRFTGGTAVLSGEAPSGIALPYPVNVPAFALAATETTTGQWNAFLAANPEWGPDRRDSLIDAGFADESYLAGWNPSAGPSLPVTGVSWFAAQAYCEWLSSKAGPGRKIALPTEAMWEAVAAGEALAAKEALAARAAGAVWSDSSLSGPAPVASKGTSASGLADMLGNVWEWSSDSWYPYPVFASNVFVPTEKTVRGGSWANTEGSVDTATRGGVAAAHASAFLGFRPALVGE